MPTGGGTPSRGTRGVRREERPDEREGDRRKPPEKGSDSERLRAAVGQDSHQLFVEEVRVGAHVFGNSLVVHLAAAVDVLFEAIVEIAVGAPVENGLLVIELDLRDEQ